AVVHDPQTIHQVLALGQPCRRRCFPERKNSAAYTVCAPASHGRSHLGDPIRGGEDVIIDERHDRSSSPPDPSIARVAYSLSRLKYVDNWNLRRFRSRIDHFGRPILRVIVDDDYLPLERARTLLRHQGSEGSLEKRGPLVRGDHYAELRRHV